MNKHNIFVDTNVLIGAYSDRLEDKNCLSYLYQLTGKRLFTSALSIAQLVSVFQKKKTNTEIKDIVSRIMAKFTVLSFVDKDIVNAMSKENCDMEDSIQYVISQKNKCLYFVTNNVKDYKNFANLCPVRSNAIRIIKKD